MKEGYVQSIISVPESLREPLIALLAEIGYEAFEENPSGVNAYIQSQIWNEKSCADQMGQLTGGPYQVIHEQLPATNWNTEWESNYPSVCIDDFCQIIPSFRTAGPGFLHTVVIDPKMSFGTGHHETTRLMIRQLRTLNLSESRVLDMGCGTAVLGILAAMRGAKEVLGIDIDPWSYENGRENIRLNDIENMQILQGDAAAIPAQKFDYILANINRNVLLTDIPVYTQHLASSGSLVLSGFYLSDAATIEACCEANGLRPISRLQEDEWLSILCTTKTIKP